MIRIFTYSSALLSCLTLFPGHTPAEPIVLDPDYTLELVSASVLTEGIAQMAFNPRDDAHLYAARSNSTVTRYDYDPVTGLLSGAIDVASGLGWHALGLGFHNDDLYVAFDKGGSQRVRPGDGRITRLSDPDENGVYRVRHDFVHSINKGDHDVNQIQIVGDSLYVGIGAVGRTGDPAEENIYTMTIARIADLRQIDFTGPIDEDFKGPTNYLADETEWTNLAGTDGQLRYYASGFRNPFGIAIDPQGDLWASSNGNSDAGFRSHDFLYKKVPAGAQGVFPPEEFGFGPPHVIGTPITPFVDLGQSPSPTGFDFIPAGRDQGKILLAQAGSNRENPPVGRDVLIIDPETGDARQLITFPMTSTPTDVVKDPFGRLLISDHGEGTVWLLTPPADAELVPLQAGDADRDWDFDSNDLVRVQIAGKYLTGLDATWGEGDWDAAPGGSVDEPPPGDGQFNQLDIIAALAPAHYLTGPYSALKPSGADVNVVHAPSIGASGSLGFDHVAQPVLSAESEPTGLKITGPIVDGVAPAAVGLGDRLVPEPSAWALALIGLSVSLMYAILASRKLPPLGISRQERSLK